MAFTTQVFGPDRPNARRAATYRLECAQVALSDAFENATPGMGIDPSSARYGALLAELRAVRSAYAQYWAG